jgi:hypothetical protein
MRRAHSGPDRRRPQPPGLAPASLLALAGEFQPKIVVSDIPLAPSFQVEGIDAEQRGLCRPRSLPAMVGLLTVKGEVIAVRDDRLAVTVRPGR